MKNSILVTQRYIHLRALNDLHLAFLHVIVDRKTFTLTLRELPALIFRNLVPFKEIYV